MLAGLTPELVAGGAFAVLAADGVGESSQGARSWIWAVAAGLLLSAALLGHAGWRTFSALPEPVRTAIAQTLRRHPRLLAVQAGVAVWTLMYVLYNLAYPTSTVPDGRQLASSSSELQAPGAPVVTPAAPALARPLLLGPAGRTIAPALAPQGFPRLEQAHGSEPPAPSSAGASASPSGSPTAAPAPAECEVRPVTDVLRALDGPIGLITSRPLGSEAAAAAEQAAGCSAPPAGWAALLLPDRAAGPVGVDRCGDVLGQLVLLRVLAPVAGLDVTRVDDAMAETTAACRATWGTP